MLGKYVSHERIAVTSRSFSRNTQLRGELLQRYANVTFNDEGVSLAGEALVLFLTGHDKAIVAMEKIDGGIIARLPQLAVISKYGVGLDNIDINALRRAGKRLGWTAGVNRRSVAELALGFMLALLRSIVQGDRLVRSGGWRQLEGGQLTGKTIGIIGCGHVGKDLVALLAPFGCRVLAHDVLHYEEFYRAHAVESASLDVLLAESDIVTVHVPYNESTHGMIGAAQIARMRSSALLINTARGGILDENALKMALCSGRIAGAALDVFGNEPPTDQELLALPNLVVTPHIGGSAIEAVLAMGRAAIEGLEAADS